MVQSISLSKLREDADYIFHNGFACSESVIYAIRKNFELDMSDDAFAMSTGFPWGLGRRRNVHRLCVWPPHPRRPLRSQLP